MKLQHDLILKKAKERGLKIIDVSKELGTFADVIEDEKKSELIYEGTPLSLINLRSLHYFDNKQLTKFALKKLAIPHPQSILFQNTKDEKFKSFFFQNKKYVCKPPDGTEGLGVEMNFTSPEAIEEYCQRNQHLGTTFMLEEQIEGEDFRMQIIDGKIVAACTREPAFVIGDGETDMKTLIENRRTIVKNQNPSNDLIIDEASHQLIVNQGLKMNDIPSKDQKIILKELANMSQGAIAIDKMHCLHDRYQEWVTQICDYLNVNYFAIDFITRSFEEDPISNAIVLEIRMVLSNLFDD